MIRKQNSEFSTSFVSEAVGSIQNTDCFAHVELDGLACYVISDGIDEKFGAKAARLCVDSIISSFNESPSISKSSLKKYANVANKILQKQSERNRLKASIIILVHNYVKMRYLLAGNVRFRLYRDGFLKFESKDQSLGMDFVSLEKIPKDKLAKHEERHNLQTYIGQEVNFIPYISKKINFINSDSIALFTRGFWENIDDGELLDLFKDAKNDPKETINTAEDMLLSKQPENLESYSIVTIFVNKTFINPNIKRAIMIAIPIILTLTIISVILYYRYINKQEKISLMEETYLQTINYILADNYIKAEIKANETIVLANELKNEEIKSDTNNILMLVENIISADEHLASGNYQSAQNAFLNALYRSKYADNMSLNYIQSCLELTANYMLVYDLISLGNTQVLNLQYDEAEEKYIEAKILASKIYFNDGIQNAIKALEDLYELQKDLRENLQNENNSKLEIETSATNFLTLGDKAFTDEDYESALVYYTSAQQKYNMLNDIVNNEMIQKKIESTDKKIENINTKHDEAIEYVNLAEQEYADKNYVQAKKYYLLAKDNYIRLNNTDKVSDIERSIEIIDLEQLGILESETEMESESESSTDLEDLNQESLELLEIENEPKIELQEDIEVINQKLLELLLELATEPITELSTNEKVKNDEKTEIETEIEIETETTTEIRVIILNPKELTESESEVDIETKTNEELINNKNLETTKIIKVINEESNDNEVLESIDS